MNCTRVLHALSHPQSSVTPVDLAMCLNLSQRQPLYQLLSRSPLKPTQRLCRSAEHPQRASLHSPYLSSLSSSSSSASSHGPSGPRSCLRRYSGGVNKKRVVFADARGLALTAVRLFIPEPSSPTFSPLLPSLVELQGQLPTSNKLQRPRLCLGFPQPVLDFKAFLARLREMHVQLESCSISEHSLSGKVCTLHVSGTERTPHIRVTFDSWRSHHDIPCTFLKQQRYGGSDVDIFTFDLSLPQNVDPKERIEFCVSYRPGPGSAPHWDDNRGQNYRVYVEKDASNANGCHPALSKHQSSLWPSNLTASLQNSADLQYLERTLSNRVRAEWKILVSAK